MPVSEENVNPRDVAPEFVTTTFCVAETAPGACAPKVSDSGETVSELPAVWIALPSSVPDVATVPEVVNW